MSREMLSIGSVRVMRADLERTVRDQLQKFVDDSGVHIRAVEVHMVDMTRLGDGARRREISHVTVELDL